MRHVSGFWTHPEPDRGRRVYNRADAEEAGLEYIGIGRGKIGGGSRLKLVSNGPEAAAR